MFCSAKLHKDFTELRQVFHNICHAEIKVQRS